MLRWRCGLLVFTADATGRDLLGFASNFADDEQLSALLVAEELAGLIITLTIRRAGDEITNTVLMLRFSRSLNSGLYIRSSLDLPLLRKLPVQSAVVDGKLVESTILKDIHQLVL